MHLPPLKILLPAARLMLFLLAGGAAVVPLLVDLSLVLHPQLHAHQRQQQPLAALPSAYVQGYLWAACHIARPPQLDPYLQPSILACLCLQL